MQSKLKCSSRAQCCPSYPRIALSGKTECDLKKIHAQLDNINELPAQNTYAGQYVHKDIISLTSAWSMQLISILPRTFKYYHTYGVKKEIAHLCILSVACRGGTAPAYVTAMHCTVCTNFRFCNDFNARDLPGFVSVVCPSRAHAEQVEMQLKSSASSVVSSGGLGQEDRM